MAISSSIRIEDGFSEPLKNLAIESWNAESAATALGKGLLEQREYFKGLQGESDELANSLKSNLLPGLQSIGRDAVAAKDSFSNMIHNRDIESAKEFADAFSTLGDNVKESSKAAAGWAVNYVRIHSLLKHKKLIGAGIMSMFASKALISTYKNTFSALQSSIEKSLDDIDITDRLTSMFGEAGAVAKDRAFALANEIGESASMVSEMAAKAAYDGIGTDHFERMMKLADKVGKLRAGESTESAASSLMSNIKSGHDASSIAQMFGGGEVMERQLKRAGYERALNRGDLDKALSIAEKIAEQAGLTDEAYANATGSMSQNYKSIMNTVDNIKRRLGEIYNQSFAPTVAKINKLVTSDSFKRLVSYAEYFVSLIGKAANLVTEGLVDNFKIVGVLIGIGIASKTIFIFKIASKILKLLGIFGGPIGFIIRKMIVIGKLLVSHIAKLGVAALKTKALAAIKIAGPFVAAGAAVAGITYGMYKLSGTTKTFTGWLKGSLAAGYQFAVNCFENIFIFIGNLPNRFKIIGLRIKQGFFAFVGFMKSKLGDLLVWLINAIVGFVQDSPLGTILDKIGVNVGGLAESAKSWASGLGENERGKVAEIEKEIQNLEQGQIGYTNVLKGTEEAFETEGAAVVGWLRKMFKQGEDQKETAQKIRTDTDKIRKFNEQEEELGWLKAFSDRQIMSSYSSMTSNTKTVNINGMSQSSLAEMGRRNISTIPSRAAM